MRLYEFVDSDEQVLSIIKPLLLRAKAEGAKSVPMSQLVNDIQDPSISPELLVSIINKHRKSLQDIITTANYDEIVLNNNEIKTVVSKQDQDSSNMKNIALKKALDRLK
jgi:hypothetical protein